MQQKNSLRIVQYLGSKVSLIPEINNEIKKYSSTGDVILDLFSGTGTIANSLKDEFRVYTNDIQMYSFYMSKLLLTYDGMLNHRSLVAELYESKEYKNNFSTLKNMFEKLITIEEKALQDNNSDVLIELSESETFYDNFQLTFKNNEVENAYKSVQNLFSKENIHNYQLNNRVFPYALFTLYYHGSYFGVKQCIAIDSLRYAIDSLYEKDSIERTICLNALMYSVSEIVSSVGKHFAQPIKLIDKNGNVKESSLRRLIKDRQKNIQEKMYDFEQEIRDNLEVPTYSNKMYCSDSIALLSHFNMGDIKLVYLDPPYTIDHYSRFYHILETLVRYDYPKLEYKYVSGEIKMMRGRYRNDRFQSAYCISSKALDEYDRLFKELSRIKCTVVMSYSDNDNKKNTRKRVIELKDLIAIAEKYFSCVNIKRLNHEYRKLNNSKVNVESKKDTELLITCF